MTSANNSPRRLLFSDGFCFLAFGGGAGLSPVAPGTVGSVVGALFYYACAALLPAAAVVGVGLLLLAIGIPICARANTALGRHDAGCIVWDEIAAFFVVLSLTPPAWEWQAAAFVLFRLLDAGKPFPLSWLDKNISGGWGVMLDDIAAAAATLMLILPAAYFLEA